MRKTPPELAKLLEQLGTNMRKLCRKSKVCATRIRLIYSGDSATRDELKALVEVLGNNVRYLLRGYVQQVGNFNQNGSDNTLKITVNNIYNIFLHKDLPGSGSRVLVPQEAPRHWEQPQRLAVGHSDHFGPIGGRREREW